VTTLRLSIRRLPKRKSVCVWLLLLAGTWTCVSDVSAEPVDLQWIPGSCNVVAVVQMRMLVNSRLGQKGKWADEVRRAYAEGLLSAPPWVRQVTQATEIGSAAHGAATTYSIYTMDLDSVIGDIAKHELAPSEKIAGSFAVLSHRNVYFVQLAPGLVGAVQPADRQAVSRWVRSHKEGALAPVSLYLKRAVETPGDAQVMIAVDLADMLNERQIRKWLATAPRLASAKNLDELAALLSSLRGARLSVTVTDTVAGRLQLDFGAPVGSAAGALRSAVLQWFDDAGARIESLAAATSSASGNSLVFDASLDERALRRILSLIQSPHIPRKGDEPASAEMQKPNAVASARYYASVLQLLKALDRQNKRADDYLKTALWHDNYARRIDGLPTIAVDSELVTWGRDVAGKLRALAASLRGASVKVDRLTRSVRCDPIVFYQWYGFGVDGPLYFPTVVGVNDNREFVRSELDVTVAKDTEEREAIWKLISEETNEIARKMEYKYHVKLELP
jgi:hypothetical protein